MKTNKGVRAAPIGTDEWRAAKKRAKANAKPIAPPACVRCGADAVTRRSGSWLCAAHQREYHAKYMSEWRRVLPAGFVRLKEAAGRLGITTRWLYKRLRYGEVDGKKIGGLWYVDEKELEHED